MNKLKVTIVSIFPKYSALWKYAFFLNQELAKNKNFEVKFLDLFKNHQNKLMRTIALLRGIKVKKTDVLILIAPLLAKTFKKSTAKLKIVVAHDLYPVTIGKSVHFIEKRIISLIYKYIKFSDVIFPVSEFCKNEIISTYNIKKTMQVVPGGINHDVFKKLKETKQQLRIKHNLPTEKKILLHVGRNDNRKKFGFVLKLLNKLNRKEFCLVKIGDISENNKRFIKINGLKNNIILLNNLTEKELCEIYNASDIFLFPSAYEGLGLPPAEAMACGLPVIAANNTGLKEVCMKESLTELNEELWLEKIHKIIQDNKIKNNIITQGIQIAKRFDWKNYAKEVEKIINSKINPKEQSQQSKLSCF